MLCSAASLWESHQGGKRSEGDLLPKGLEKVKDMDLTQESLFPFICPLIM